MAEKSLFQNGVGSMWEWVRAKGNPQTSDLCFLKWVLPHTFCIRNDIKIKRNGFKRDKKSYRFELLCSVCLYVVVFLSENRRGFYISSTLISANTTHEYCIFFVWYAAHTCPEFLGIISNASSFRMLYIISIAFGVRIENGGSFFLFKPIKKQNIYRR